MNSNSTLLVGFFSLIFPKRKYNETNKSLFQYNTFDLTYTDMFIYKAKKCLEVVDQLNQSRVLLSDKVTILSL